MAAAIVSGLKAADVLLDDQGCGQVLSLAFGIAACAGASPCFFLKRKPLRSNLEALAGFQQARRSLNYAPAPLADSRFPATRAVPLPPHPAGRKRMRRCEPAGK